MRGDSLAVLIALTFFTAWRVAVSPTVWWVTAILVSIGLIVGWLVVNLLERRARR